MKNNQEQTTNCSSPIEPVVSLQNKPTKYHCYDSCNKCSSVNDYTVTDSLDGRMLECKTKCRECGFTDYWAHGWFESGQETESKCKTYSFAH